MRPDSACEDERVEPPKCSGQSAEELLSLVAEERDRLGSALVVRFATQQIMHVRACVRDPEQPRLSVDQFAHLQWTQPLFLEQVKDHTGIQARRPSGLSDSELSQPVAPSKGGRRPSLGKIAAPGSRCAGKRLWKKLISSHLRPRDRGRGTPSAPPPSPREPARQPSGRRLR